MSTATSDLVLADTATAAAYIDEELTSTVLAEESARDGYSETDAASIPCYLRTLDHGILEEAAQEAITVNPENAQPVLPTSHPDERKLRLALLVRKRWPRGIRLTVGFIDQPPPHPTLRARILSHMNAWGQHSDVLFIENAHSPQVRISFTRRGYWSYLGTDIKGVAAHLPTMNLQGFNAQTTDQAMRRVVRHETGHTLGFPHEHLRYQLVNWIDPAKAIDYYKRPPNSWTPEQTRANVLTPLLQNDIIASAVVDVHSIMCYPLPREIMRPGAPVFPGGGDLSTIDQNTARYLYGPPRPAQA